MAAGWPPIERWIGSDVDVVHSLALGYPVCTGRPLVVTVHDIGPLTHPQYFRSFPAWVMRRGVQHLERRADAIICVSQATADELQSYFGGGLDDRLHVVYEGIAAPFSGGTEAIEGSDCVLRGLQDAPFFLVAGASSPRKNLVRVLAAFDEVASSFPHHLVMVGGQGWAGRRDRSPDAAPRHRNRIHEFGFVSDLQLAQLYRRASAFVYASLYEGFGLPVLEAMSVGCPVLASSIPPLREICSDAALFFDPEDTAEIVNQMMSVASDDGLAQQLRVSGVAQAASFTWRSCAEQTAEVYRQVAGGM
jgi:glycosyltransferase involved in cell wall biosynthesis